MKNQNIKILLVFLFAALTINNGWSEVEDFLIASEKKNRKFDYFFLEALKMKQQGNHSEAFQLFNHCLSIDSTSAVVHYEISNYYLFLKRANEVVAHLEKAVEYNPNSFDYKIALANVSRQLGMNEEAVGAYEELAAKHPDKPELNYYLSEIYVKQGKIDNAIEALNVLEESIGMNESLSVQKYRLYASIEKQAEANNEIIKLVEKYPTDPRYSIMMGDLYLEQNNPENAHLYYMKAHEIDSGNPYYTVSMANYYEHIQDNEAAQKQIDMSLRNTKLDIDTKLSILVRYIATLYREKKNTDGVDALFKTIMEQHPLETDLNMLYGNFLMSKNKVEEAKFQYQIITEASPGDEEAWKQLLGLSLREENMDDCIRICQAAQMHFPENADFYFYEGVGYYQKEEYENALSTFKKGVIWVDENNVKLLSDFYGQIGDLYHHLNKKEKAYEHYELALKHDRNITVMNNYAYFLSLDKRDLSKAERMAAQCVQAQPDNSTFIDTYAWVLFVQENYSLAKFYIESAISKGGDKNAEIVDHYGDILYKSGNKEKAIDQWNLALELGKDTEIIRKKIAEETYYEDIDDAN